MSEPQGDLATKERVEELRQSGEIPFSRGALRLFATAAVLLCGEVLYTRWSELVALLFAKAGSYSPGLYFNTKLVGKLIVDIMLLPAWCVLAVVLTFGLIQAKFFFSAEKIGFAFERLAPSAGSGRKKRAFLMIVVVLTALTMTVLAALQLIAPLGTLLSEEGSIGASLAMLYRMTRIRAVALLVFGGMCAWGLSWLLFMYRNRGNGEGTH